MGSICDFIVILLLENKTKRNADPVNRYCIPPAVTEIICNAWAHIEYFTAFLRELSNAYPEYATPANNSRPTRKVNKTSIDLKTFVMLAAISIKPKTPVIS